MSKDVLPPTVVEALVGGNKLEAIRRLKQITGMDLKAARDWVESYIRTNPEPGSELLQSFEGEASTRPHSPPKPAALHARPGLAPGEVPPGRGAAKWLALIAVGLIAVLAALYFRR